MGMAYGEVADEAPSVEAKRGSAGVAENEDKWDLDNISLSKDAN